ncbi:MAG: hypothetical protein WA324_30440 [Bryobacteraceae bacterium]
MIATTWPLRLLKSGLIDSNESIVKVHTGSISWTIEIRSGLKSTVRFDSGCQIYAGCVRSRARANSGLVEAVVIEADNSLLGEAPLEVWAERLGRGVKRQRVGSPFLTGLNSQNESLAELYYSSSPKQDSMLLSQELARQITVRTRLAGHVSNPDEYGHRIASVLLPDVIHYDRKQPLGFSFAAQNGRHPADESADIVATIINGVPGPAEPSRRTQIRQTFPYFPIS